MTRREIKMKTTKKILALLLSLLMLAGVMSSVTLPALAADKNADEEEEVTGPTAEEIAAYYLNKAVYENPYEKLASMTKYYETGKYELWGLEQTGEIALVDKATGQILFSNPYDVSTMSKDPKKDEVKKQLLSQVILKYSNSSQETIMYSFTEAAVNSQIKMVPIRGGLRVEYTMGREQARVLVPNMMERTRFEEKILNKMPHYDADGKKIYDEKLKKCPYDYMKAFYGNDYKSLDKAYSDTARQSLIASFPIIEKYDIYVLGSDTGKKDKENLEYLITAYTDYSFDDMDEDYSMLEYEANVSAMPLFKVALEYYPEDEGLRVRCPSSDIRFDSSTYSVTSISFLPFFGAGASSDLEGFTFIPDGSGAIVDFADVKDSVNELTITGKLYGPDYSYHQITGKNQEIMRLPVYGISRTSEFTEFDEEAYTEKFSKIYLTAAEEAAAAEAEGLTTDEATAGETTADEAKADETKTEDAAADETTAETTADETTADEATAEETADETTADETTTAEETTDETTVDETTADETAEPENDKPKKTETAGFVAYIEEGDALAEISTVHGGIVHKYNSTRATFFPKPSDSYELTGISATGSATWSVTSDRKYTGNFTIRFIPTFGEKTKIAGMAETVRDYLVSQGKLSKLENKGDDIPLYLENFGSIKTQQKVFGFPVSVQTPLTTFDDCITMLEELKAEGISNINVRYKGWYNGGLYATVPNKIKVDKAVGGEKGLEKLAAYASENGIGLYPDLELLHVMKVGTFDGFNYKKDAIQTIDERTAVHKTYSALFQGYEDDGILIVTPESIAKYIKNSSSDYAKFGLSGISVGSLGDELNSDHNKDYPLTRVDAEEIISEQLAGLKESDGSVMVDSGNAYVLGSADHILGLPLDSSKNVYASAAVPFYGMVLHGYVEYAGTAINLDGDFEYSVLKAIESGASPYFILSYRHENTSELKSFTDFSKYYSIRYNIWKDDLFGTYKKLNDALKTVKYDTITEHEILDTRVVKVTYSGGTSFILNYNTKPVTVDGETIPAMDFLKK